MLGRRTFLAVCLTASCRATCAAAPQVEALARGRRFLINLMDPMLSLLPEYSGSIVYWLWHDNYLAARTLATNHPEISRRITAAIELEHFTQTDGKMELLCGESPSILPFRHHALIDVRRVGDKRVRTEVATDREMSGWESYADLLFFASLAENEPLAACRRWEAALAMWDGRGFFDAAAKAHRQYATYKLAMALIAANRLAVQQQVPAGLVDRLQGLQSEQGGWITDYLPDSTPHGRANVETTCMVILGLENYLR